MLDILGYVIYLLMDSAPNSETMLTFLRERGFHFSNERGIHDTCRDSKAFIGLLYDIIVKEQPDYLRNWIASESYTFSQDPDRNRSSLPVVSQVLVIQEMANKLGVKMRLMKLFSKNSGDIGMQILTKEKMVKNFVEIKKQAYQESFTIYKATFQKLSQSQANLNETKRIKEQQKAEYDHKMSDFHELADGNQDNDNEIRKLARQIDQASLESKETERKLLQYQRDVEQKQIRISQCKRELIKLAPDIKKEKEHLEVILNDLAHLKKYQERVWEHISEELNLYQNLFSQTQSKLREWIQVSRSDCDTYGKKVSQLKQEERNKKDKVPVLFCLKEKKLRLQGQNTSFQTTIGEREDNTSLMKAQMTILYNNFRVHEETINRMNHGLIEDENFIKETEVQKNNNLLLYYNLREEMDAKLRAQWERVQKFMEEVQSCSTEFYKQFENPEEQGDPDQ